MDETDEEDPATPELVNATEVALERVSSFDSVKERQLLLLVVPANGSRMGCERGLFSEGGDLRELSLEPFPG